MSIGVGPKDSQELLELAYTVLMLATWCAHHDSTFVAAFAIRVFVRLYKCRNSRSLDSCRKTGANSVRCVSSLKTCGFFSSKSFADLRRAILICSRRTQN